MSDIYHSGEYLKGPGGIILPIERGGTGNNAGYIRTGQKSGTTIGDYATAEGLFNTASGEYSHAEGDGTKATNSSAHAEGNGTEASGMDSHAEGSSTTASGSWSHAEGDGTKATKASAHAEGSETTASGMYSHAEGQGTSATKNASHAEGYGTVASGNFSHAEGRENTASGVYSHAEGYENTASGDRSHAGGHGTIAAYEAQTVIGRFNSNKSNTLFEVGNGTSTVKSNAFEVHSNGDINLTGNLLRNAARVKFNDWSYSTADSNVDFIDGSYRTISSFTINDQSWTSVYIKLNQTILNNLKTYQQVLTFIKTLQLSGNDGNISVDIRNLGMNYFYTDGQYTGIYLYGQVKSKGGSHTINNGYVTVIGFPSLFFDDEIRKRCIFNMMFL